MQIRLFQAITIFAQRISFQSTCVKIRTTSCSTLLETKRDYYSEEFTIGGRTSESCKVSKSTKSISSGAVPEVVLTSLSVNQGSFPEFPVNSEKSEHRMPVVAAVVAHRRILPAASSLANSAAGSQRSSGVGRRPSALNVLPSLIDKTGVSRKISTASKYSASGLFAGADVSRETCRRCEPFLHKQYGAATILKAPGKENVLMESRRYYAKGKDKPKSKATKIVVNEDEMREVIDVDKYKLQLEKQIEQMKEEFTKQLNVRGAAGELNLNSIIFILFKARPSHSHIVSGTSEHAPCGDWRQSDSSRDK